MEKYLRFVVKRYLFVPMAFVFVLLYWSSASKLQAKSIVFPKAITALMIPLFIWAIIDSIRDYRALAANKEIPEEKKWDCSLRITKTKLCILGATILYLILLPIIGYCVMTMIYIAGLSYYLGNRNIIMLIVYTGSFFGVLYLVFVWWLKIRVPAGFLF